MVKRSAKRSHKTCLDGVCSKCLERVTTDAVARAKHERNAFWLRICDDSDERHRNEIRKLVGDLFFAGFTEAAIMIRDCYSLMRPMAPAPTVRNLLNALRGPDPSKPSRDVRWDDTQKRWLPREE